VHRLGQPVFDVRWFMLAALLVVVFDPGQTTCARANIFCEPVSMSGSGHEQKSLQRSNFAVLPQDELELGRCPHAGVNCVAPGRCADGRYASGSP
jgi:hypothetical protein